MTDIRFTASTSSWGTQLFRNEDDFLQYLDTLWSTYSWDSRGRRYERERLWDKVYDIEIHDGESDNAWRFDEAA